MDVGTSSTARVRPVTVPAAAVSLVGVSKTYRAHGRQVAALQDATVHVRPGEVVSLVGESGCGKTTTGRILAGLLSPTSGTVQYAGQDAGHMSRRERRRHQLRVQLIHQDPYASLDPTLRVREVLAGPLRRHSGLRGAAVRQRTAELLETVDLRPADNFLDKFPHEISGGQRQRVAIARALTVDPDVIVADEAVSMIDVSLRLSVLATLDTLRRDRGLALVFITHDLGLARHIAPDGQLVVMYLGRVVEQGPTAQVLDDPTHPYTRALLGAVPPGLLDPRGDADRIVATEAPAADLPPAGQRPSGCAFHPRCPLVMEGVCSQEEPALTDRQDGRATACHRHDGDPP